MVPEVRAFLRKTPADDFVSPSANCTRVGAHISPDRFWSLRTLAEHLSDRGHGHCGSSMFRHARVLGQTVEQALVVDNHSGGQVLLSQELLTLRVCP